jgi:YVTN family beta-propeller protein
MNAVEMFDLLAGNYLPPIPVGTSPHAISLTPDGSKLVVGNAGGGSLSIIDPTTSTVSATIDISHQKNCNYVNLQLQPADVVLTNTGKAVVSVYCPGTSPGSGLVIVDLNSQQFGCGISAGCSQMVAAMQFSPTLSSSGDGTRVFLNDNSTGTGAVGLWDVTSDTFSSAFCYFGDAAPGGATSSDGTVFANGYGILESDFNQRYYMHEIDYLAVGPDGYIGGTNTNETLSKEKLHPSGSLLYIPGWVGHLLMNPGKIDIFDVHHGRLAMQVLVPDGMVQTSDEMAVDENGSRIFLITSTGLTVVQLAQVPLSIGTVAPSSGAAGTVVTIRGSGFQIGAAVKLGTTSVPNTVADENTIQLTTPSLPVGPVRITVTNSNGSSYGLDAAFTAN